LRGDRLRWQRGLLAAVTVCCVIALQAQEKDLWGNFRFDDLHAKTNTILLRHSQIVTIQSTLKARMKKDSWCEPEDGQEWLDGLKFDEVPLKKNVRVVRATAGVGCARGGQGANGGMWLFQVEGQRIRFIGALSGWGMAVQPTEVDGFHDFVTGWHMSAAETGLSYYRFDGKVYKSIDGTSAVSDSNGTWQLERDQQGSPQK
jgi:hypothetical protein